MLSFQNRVVSEISELHPKFGKRIAECFDVCKMNITNVLLHHAHLAAKASYVAASYGHIKDCVSLNKVYHKLHQYADEALLHN